MHAQRRRVEHTPCRVADGALARLERKLHLSPYGFTLSTSNCFLHFDPVDDFPYAPDGSWAPLMRVMAVCRGTAAACAARTPRASSATS